LLSTTDVKQEQILEAEDKSWRMRTNLKGQGQSLEAEDKFEAREKLC